LSNIKNFTLFESDLVANTLPQWLVDVKTFADKRAFFTPNMKNDGHDTDVNYAANWTRTVVTPLLSNPTFNSNGTLIMITFDEDETYTIKNNVWALLLGSAIPPSLRGTTDNTFYTHYSCLSTVENNWGLYNLGRGDVNANYSNVFQLVANVTGYKNVNVSADDIPYFNFTASGYFDTSDEGPIPAVLNLTGAGGKGLLPSLMGVNGSAIPPPPSSASSTASASAAASSSASTSKSAAVRQFTYSFEALTGCICVLIAFSIGLVV
jgi:Phosphoesterase family